MRYLTVAANYTQSGLRDDFGGSVEPEALDLPAALCDELRAWNHEYRKVIPLEEEERSKADTSELIGGLDKQGQEIADQVVAALKQQAKVRYYSEGHLQYLVRENWVVSLE